VGVDINSDREEWGPPGGARLPELLVEQGPADLFLEEQLKTAA
jgi:hypothetical protein